MDGENGIEKKFIKKGKVVDIENKTIHSPQEGKNKWLSLFSARVASSVPRKDIEEESVCSDRAQD
jgi:hypothetical protein